jgi:hypothetical protein
MGKVMINQGRSVPLTFRFVGLLAIVALIILALENLPEMYAIILAILLSLLVPLLWFSFQILTVDTDNKEVHDGIWLMGYKTGRPKKFNAIDTIFINKVKTSQSMYSQANRQHTSRGIEYHAYLKFDNEEKYFLLSNKNEKKLEDKLIKIRQKLGLS